MGSPAIIEADPAVSNQRAEDGVRLGRAGAEG